MKKVWKNHVRMKSCLSVILASAIMVSMTACGGAGNGGSGNDGAGNSGNGNIGNGNGAGTADEKTDITMVLDWTPNTNHTGLYAALEEGYFDEAGLNVSIIQPPDGGATSLVASGGAQFGVDFQDYLADAFGASEPLPVTAVAAILQHNTSGIISLKEDGITGPKELEGKNYATWDLPIEQKILQNVVEKDGGDFSKVNLISTYVEDIVAALHADIDAVWIYYGWDGIAAQKAGLDTNYFYFKDINDVFDYYSPVLIANDDFLAEHPEEAKAFVAAVSRGYEYVIANPEEAAQILLKYAPELDETMVKESQKWLTDQYQSDAKQWGYIDPQRWNRFYSWLNENGLVENEIPENTGFTNDFLPDNQAERK